MDTDAKPAAFSGCRHAGGFHRMVELVNTYGYPLDEMASGLGQPNAACMTLEQEDAEVFFQCLHAGADAGLRRFIQQEIDQLFAVFAVRSVLYQPDGVGQRQRAAQVEPAAAKGPVWARAPGAQPP